MGFTSVSSAATATEFLYYGLCFCLPRISALAGEQAVPIVNKTLFGETVVAMPAQKAEQEAIATVFSDMDAELEALDTKLTKARQIKEGMMHELLTGRIRLV
ncbi:MAG: hypothetical protein KAI47_23240 [Deltaproteobacteria bacterium]|nr:hypothetical protein [Deltaproteobacteria bacterium]